MYLLGSESLLFHGGDTGSTPVRDANILRSLPGSVALSANDDASPNLLSIRQKIF
jgi:hypothetical protein